MAECQTAGCELPKRPGAGQRSCEWHWLLKQPMDTQRAAASAREAIEHPPGPLPHGHVATSCGCGPVPRFYVPSGRVCRAHAALRRTARTYGITPAELEALAVIQGRVCGACGNHQRIKALATDHDHGTGEVRGYLCQTHNIMIGELHDSPRIALAIAVYLLNPPALQLKGVQLSKEQTKSAVLELLEGILNDVPYREL